VITFDEHRLLAVVRYREACDLDAILDGLRTAGVTLLEVTADTPGGLHAVARAAGAGTPIGAGTIRTAEEAKAFANAGAAFLVSPAILPDVVDAADASGVPLVPGALTPTEIAAASATGAWAVKLFPARLGGPGYLRDLRGPFPDVRLVPTGGIPVEDVPAWLDAGAACVGLGSALLGSAPPRTPAEFDALIERASRAVELAGGRG
jgi:2-dehydro-3-deoxyphosphogluconate aldolase/(4S)-4-hydroxy-2-oxoglutarate aldolase